MTRAGWLSAAAAVLTSLASVSAWQREPGQVDFPAASPTPDVSTATAASTSPPNRPLDGAALFQAKGCAACHAGPDSPTDRQDRSTPGGFPSLADASSWAGDRRADLTAAEYLSQSIREPWAFTSPRFSAGAAGPTTAMPALGLSEEEVDAVVDYLLAG